MTIVPMSESPSARSWPLHARPTSPAECVSHPRHQQAAFPRPGPHGKDGEAAPHRDRSAERELSRVTAEHASPARSHNAKNLGRAELVSLWFLTENAC